MKINRVRLTYAVCERIFAALSSPLPKEVCIDCINIRRKKFLDMNGMMAYIC